MQQHRNDQSEPKENPQELPPARRLRAFCALTLDSDDLTRWHAHGGCHNFLGFPKFVPLPATWPSAPAGWFRSREQTASPVFWSATRPSDSNHSGRPLPVVDRGKTGSIYETRPSPADLPTNERR